MKPRRPAALRPVIVAALALLAVFADQPGAARDRTRAFLSEFSITAADVARIDAGHVVSRTLPSSDHREVATLGVVRAAVTPRFYVEQLADIARLKQDEAILQIGTFANPPTPADIADLTLDEADVRSLRRCRVGRCGVQLPAEAIARFRREIDWTRHDAAARANTLMREILVDYVGEYMRSGAAAAMAYADRAEPLDVRLEFASLADSAAHGLRQFPALRRHLFQYPATKAPDTTDLVYWSKERIGRKGVATVTHLAIARLGGASPADYAVASRQLYGAHYYDASLGLTVLVPAHGGTGASTYVVYLNRSRIDVFRGMFGGVARRLVTSRARSTVADRLADLRATLEQRFAGGQ